MRVWVCANLAAVSLPALQPPGCFDDDDDDDYDNDDGHDDHDDDDDQFL